MNKKEFDIIKKGVSDWNIYRDTTILVTKPLTWNICRIIDRKSVV